MKYNKKLSEEEIYKFLKEELEEPFIKQFGSLYQIGTGDFIIYTGSKGKEAFEKALEKEVENYRNKKAPN